MKTIITRCRVIFSNLHCLCTDVADMKAYLIIIPYDKLHWLLLHERNYTIYYYRAHNNIYNSMLDTSYANRKRLP